MIRDSDSICLEQSPRICIFNKTPEVLDSWACCQLPTRHLNVPGSGTSQWVLLGTCRGRLSSLPCSFLHPGLTWAYRYHPWFLPHLINHQTLLSFLYLNLSISCHSHIHFPTLNNQSLACITLMGSLPLILPLLRRFPHCSHNDLPKTQIQPCHRLA